MSDVPATQETSSRSPYVSHHGQSARNLAHEPPQSLSYAKGKFGRMFPMLFHLPDTEEVRDALLWLGSLKGPMALHQNDKETDVPENPTIPAGFTFFAQFVDHDVTFDPTSTFERQIDPETIGNFRTPLLELDSVYGSGPGVNPYIFDQMQDPVTGLPKDGAFLIENTDEEYPKYSGGKDDLPRNRQNIALIGDPRNDENLIIGQVHLAFLKYHNSLIDQGMSFKEAQQETRWHYQYIVVNDFLRGLVGTKLVDEILDRGPKIYKRRNHPFMPSEFSVAAYRFGHAQVRPSYRLHAGVLDDAFAAPIFDAKLDQKDRDPADCRGSKRAKRRFCQMQNFFNLGSATPQFTKKITPKLANPLFTLPFVMPGMPREDPQSLAQRNLLRSLVFKLPSGQRIARFMGEQPLSPGDFDFVADGLRQQGNKTPLHRETPLWFYILREAEVQHGGERLGTVGGRIIADVLLGLLLGDRGSYLRQDPSWRPPGVAAPSSTEPPSLAGTAIAKLLEIADAT